MVIFLLMHCHVFQQFRVTDLTMLEDTRAHRCFWMCVCLTHNPNGLKTDTAVHTDVAPKHKLRH